MSYPDYHAHVYYEPETRTAAARVRKELDVRFRVRLGRWHDEPVGPHPQAMYQVAFEAEQFAAIVPWLMANRDGLTVLVHPVSGDDYGDHTERALWMGRMLPLNLEALR